MLEQEQPQLTLLKNQKYVLDSSDENVVGIKNALNWGYESKLHRSDRVMAFIQTAIALESLLGEDSDTKDKTRQLADRCSMIIGKNRKERQEIRDRFIEFYKVRSSIVHGALTKSDEKLKENYYWASWALDALLGRELLRSKWH